MGIRIDWGCGLHLGVCVSTETFFQPVSSFTQLATHLAVGIPPKAAFGTTQGRRLGTPRVCIDSLRWCQRGAYGRATDHENLSELRLLPRAA